ncbi:MAG: hypothetical protein HUU46_09785 [Candidatus Hydrogenedentes bacterium]|nr:hypothetical protein [Candidatus Hydrogenedentota bacterium]
MASVRAGSVFLVSCAALSYEVLLTRYFAVASWSEYGYWVISIAMTGFAVSGVLLALFRSAALARKEFLFRALPLLLMVAAAAGYYFTTINPFNPLELQNAVLWKSQLANIGKFYAALFPFYFLSGFFLGLSWSAFQSEVAKLYAADLIGAGVGATAILVLMFVVHPFYLICAVPLVLFVAALLNAPKTGGARTWSYAALAIVVVAACEVSAIAFNKARFFEYKSIYPVMNVQDNKVLESYRTPRGYYLLLDNFTERRDLALSNNLGLMGSTGTPASPGLYKDGNRMASILPGGEIDLSYVPAALSSLPYTLRPAARALLVGSSGGYRPIEVQTGYLGVVDCLAIESDPIMFNLAAQAFDALSLDRSRIVRASPQAVLARETKPFDVIDVSDDYMDEGPANKYAFTVDAIQAYMRALAPDGIVSIPISIREFPVYAVRLAETARVALRDLPNPEQHIVVYRSEWTARILISKAAFSADDLELIRKFCSDLSFDTSYFAGIDPAAVEVWNELPPVSFETKTEDTSREGPQDALRDDLIALFGPDGDAFRAESFFNLTPSTADRPYLNYVFRPSRLGSLLDKLEIVPHEEVGFLTNIAVLAQALVMAVIVLLLPLARWKTLRAGNAPIVRGVCYFAALGLGFLFIEIALIDKFARLLNDSVSSFAIVLCGMLIFSGLGSALSGRFGSAPRRGVRVAVVLIALSCVLYAAALDTAIGAALAWPYAIQIALIVVALAPASLALGMMFPLGMASLTSGAASFVPIAWAVNGAFSVIASPLASLLAVMFGYRVLFAVACVAYVMALFAQPTPKAAAQ